MSANDHELEDNSTDDEKDIMRRNWERNVSDIQKTAYREGATSSSDQSDVMLQMGFNKGYEEGFKDGFKNGSYKSTMMLLNKFNFSENDEEN